MTRWHTYHLFLKHTMGVKDTKTNKKQTLLLKWLLFLPSSYLWEHSPENILENGKILFSIQICFTPPFSYVSIKQNTQVVYFWNVRNQIVSYFPLYPACFVIKLLGLLFFSLREIYLLLCDSSFQSWCLHKRNLKITWFWLFP